MNEIAQIIAAARATVQDPRSAARRVIALDLPQNTALLALVTVGILTTILSSLVMVPADPAQLILTLSPVQLAVVQVGGLLVSVGLIQIVGGWFGGKGQLRHAIALVAWSETILLFVQIAQLFALVILPPVAVILALFGLGLMVWLAVIFIAELHGFASLQKVLLGIIVTVLGASLALAILLAITVGPIGG